MHRTQISIQEAQYRHLQQEAQRIHGSLSLVVRKLLDDHMKRYAKSGHGSLSNLEGIGEGTGEAVGRNHNHFLYGK